MYRPRTHQHLDGFSFVELLITISIFGILSSIALVNLSSSWSKARLVSTTRELENWLSEQRRYAMSQNLTYRICIDENNKKLFSTIDSSTGSVSCTGVSSDPNAGVFDLDSNFGNGNEDLKLEACTAENKKVGVILFSHQGFSDQIISDDDRCKEEPPTGDGVLELRLKHPDLKQQRCIRIISPIGMIRDGSTQGQSPKCHYDKTY